MSTDIKSEYDELGKDPIDVEALKLGGSASFNSTYDGSYFNGQPIPYLEVDKLRTGTLTSQTITLAVRDGFGDTYIAAGKTDFSTTTAGFILGLDDSDSNKAKFYLGDTTSYLTWDGSTLSISGSIVAGSIHIPDENTTANSFHVDGDGNMWLGCTHTDFTSDNDNAAAYILKTGAAKLQSVTLETSVIVKDLQAGSVISGTYVDALAVSKLTAGTITSKEITLAVSAGTGDVFINAGKTDFDNTQAGFILGIDDSDSDLAKFFIGDTSQYLNWDGSSLIIRGDFKVYLSSTVTAGVDIGSDTFVYVDNTDGKAYPAGACLGYDRVIGAVETGVSAAAAVTIQTMGVADHFSGLTLGKNNYLVEGTTNFSIDISDTEQTIDNTAERYAQNWTTGGSETRVDWVQLKLQNLGAPTGDITVEIFAVDGSSEPTGAALATSTIRASVVPGKGLGYEEFVAFPMGIDVSASTEYSVVIKYGITSATDYPLWTYARSGTTYQGWVSVDSGGTWADMTTIDAAFEGFDIKIGENTGAISETEGSGNNTNFKRVGITLSTTSLQVLL